MELGFSSIFGIFSAENWENSPVFMIGKGADYRPQIGPRKIPVFTYEIMSKRACVEVE